MKIFVLLLVVFTISFYACKSSNKEIDSKEQKSSSKFNPELVEKLEADKYGMSQYVLAFLKAGPNRSQDSISAAALQKAHLDNITRLANKGKLVLAGPFMDNGDIRGIYIFNVSSIEEARKLTESDPAIQAGRLIMELRPWYGSAALKQINKLHETIAKKKF